MSRLFLLGAIFMLSLLLIGCEEEQNIIPIGTGSECPPESGNMTACYVFHTSNFQVNITYDGVNNTELNVSFV